MAAGYLDKRLQVRIAPQFLDLILQNNIVVKRQFETMDENWVYHKDPKQRQQTGE